MADAQELEQSQSSEERIQQLEAEISRLKELNARLEVLAGKDALTELNNRRRLEEDLKQTIGESIREGEEFTYLILDLDRFKDINDTLGHDAGDEALKTVSVVLVQELHRPGDSVYRLGGDEFAVILRRTAIANGVYVATILQDAINKLEFTVNGTRVPIITSIGVTSFNPEQSGEGAKGISIITDPNTIAREADQALYSAKRDRNKVGFFCRSELEKFEVGQSLRRRQVDINRVIPFTQPPTSGRT